METETADNDGSRLKKRSRSNKVALFGVLWFSLTILLLVKFSITDGIRPVFFLLLPAFSAFVLASFWYEWWFLSVFRYVVTGVYLWFAVFLQVVVIGSTVFAAEEGCGGTRFFAVFIVLSALHAGVVALLYRKEKRKLASLTRRPDQNI